MLISFFHHVVAHELGGRVKGVHLKLKFTGRTETPVVSGARANGTAAVALVALVAAPLSCLRRAMTSYRLAATSDSHSSP